MLQIADLPVAVRKPLVERTVDLLNTLEQSGEQDPLLLLELANAWRG